MITRKRVPELMDDPNLDYHSHAQALRGLARLNAASLSVESIWSQIEAEARRTAGPLRILDIATGGGDIPIALYLKAKLSGLKVEIIGSDISADAISYAKDMALVKRAEIQFISMDVFKDELPTDFDIIVTSLFTHHLDPDDVVMLLTKMSQAARLKVIVNDLVRSEVSYYSVWLATRLLSRSAVVHYDGPVSVNASYTASEFLEMANKAGMSTAMVKSFPLVGSYLYGAEELKTMNSVSQQIYDAVIIGAGPAGAFTALQLASAGKKVILLDKAYFPRSKVCGCCINHSAQRVLQRAVLDAIFTQSGAVPLSTLQLIDGTASAMIELSGGHALSRDYFDTALIGAAVAAGAKFVPGVTAKVSESTGQSKGELIRVQITAKDLVSDLESRVTIVADGLNGHALDLMPGFATIAAADARFGCGTTFFSSNFLSNSHYRPGRIYMACQHGGYVGLVVLESGAIDIACALDRSYVRQQESLPAAVAAILSQCNLPLPVSSAEFAANHWHGTDALTRRRSKISGQRLFVVGDACGYPEPLTGEGIAWALESAEAVVPLALSAIEQWSDALSSQWQQVHGRLVYRRQLKSRLIAYSLRNRLSRRVLIQAVSAFPLVAQGIAASLTRQPPQSVASK